MKKGEIESIIMVSGDNSLGQLWCKKETQVAAKFTKANDFPYESKISHITKISAYNQSIAFCFDDSHIVFRNDEGNITDYNLNLIKQICCLEKTVLALLKDGRIYDCASDKYYPNNDYIDMNASKTFRAAVRSNGDVIILNLEKSEQKVLFKKSGAKVGCTEDQIFIIDNKGQLKVSFEDKIIDIQTPVKLISVATSETEAVFIDTNGGLWHYQYEALMQVYGLPPVVYASVGIQHYAAISFDGSLYTWGFNPSGQLGIGSDKSSLDPSKVLENIKLVCCGTHHTLAIKGEKPDIPSQFNKSVISHFAHQTNSVRSNISRAEILC